MKLTNSTRGSAPQAETAPGAGDKSGSPATSTRESHRLDGFGSALKNLRKAFSTTHQPPATPAPRRSVLPHLGAEAHRSEDVAAAIKHMHKGHTGSVARKRVPADQIASTSQAHAQPPHRLGELMDEEHSTSLTKRFVAKGKYAAEFQPREPEPDISSNSPEVAVPDEQDFEAMLAAMQSRATESQHGEVTPAIRAIMEEMGSSDMPRASRKPALGTIPEEPGVE
ncbi:hypothetical protein R69746_08586 [Paraburkholderia aspalathi]|nr:hypothetical protein R69746_08586 [Paraburkholderia aspalathi]